MQTLHDLEEYFIYMRQIGYTGLALEHNPFRVAQPAPTPRSQAMPARAQAPSRPRPVPTPPPERKQRPTPARPSIVDLDSIVDMASAPTEDTAAKVAAVTGETPMDILRGLYQAFHQCQACALGTTRRNFVFAEGPPDARLMFVGEAPGPEDDNTGMPFSQESKAGELLTRIIEGMGFKRDQVFITTAVKCHPPEGRTPLADELATCAPLLARQIETVKPKAVVALGPNALRFFLGPDVSFANSRGRFFKWRGFDVMPTYDPYYILRNPVSKRETWADLKQVIAHLRNG
jgi:DNA polymerase